MLMTKSFQNEQMEFKQNVIEHHKKVVEKLNCWFDEDLNGQIKQELTIDPLIVRNWISYLKVCDKSCSFCNKKMCLKLCSEMNVAIIL